MKVLKVFAAFVLSVIMICASVATLGSFAVEQATCEKSIRNALEKTEVLDTLMDEVLSENTVNMGGVYGSAAKAIMQTDAMEQFIIDYTAAALSAEFYGREREEIANDELMEAFAAGIDEAAEEKGFMLTPSENELIRKAMLTTIPALTTVLNDALNQYETTAIDGETMQRLEDLRMVVSPAFRYGSMAVALLMLLLLVLLFRESRMGFMWGAVNVILASCIYGVAAFVSASFGDQPSSFVEPMERMLYVMCEYGSSRTAIGGGTAGVILIIICVIMRAFRRHDYELS